MRSLKIKDNKLKKDRVERKEIQKKLQEELEILSVNNKKNSKKYERVMGTEVKL